MNYRKMLTTRDEWYVEAPETCNTEYNIEDSLSTRDSEGPLPWIYQRGVPFDDLEDDLT